MKEVLFMSASKDTKRGTCIEVYGITCSDHKAVSVIECETRNNEDAE